jgi:hypothetical protein
MIGDNAERPACTSSNRKKRLEARERSNNEERITKNENEKSTVGGPEFWARLFFLAPRRRGAKAQKNFN